MKFHVAGLLQDAVGATRRHDVDDEVGRIDENVTTLGRVRGTVKLTRTNQGILVAAQLHVTVLLDCGRCLNEFALPVQVRFSEQFRPVLDISSGLPLPGPEDPSIFTIDENHVLDITEAVRQYTLLALPLAPLCKPTCAGLCPTCGQNLNEGPCQCEPIVGDERLRALSELLDLKDDEPAPEAGSKKNQDRKRRTAR